MGGGALGHPAPVDCGPVGQSQLGKPVGQGYGTGLLARDRPSGGLPGEGASRRCCTNFIKDWLTGWPGLSCMIGTPLFTEMGTARLEGMCAAISERTTFRTWSRLSPTFESARLTTTERICSGYDITSILSSAARGCVKAAT